MIFNIFPRYKRDLPNVRAPRTIADKIMEVAAAILLVLIWVLAVIFYHKLPDIIPVHFNFLGEVDKWGNKGYIFLMAGIATLAMIGTGVSAYFPTRMTNFPIRLTEKNILPQVKLASHYLRILNILLGILFIIILCSMSESLFPVRQGLFTVLAGNVVLLLVLSILIYYILARKYFR